TARGRVPMKLVEWPEKQESWKISQQLVDWRACLIRCRWSARSVERSPHTVLSDQSHWYSHYGIRGLEEARRYLAHPVLGPRLEAATRCVLQAGVPPPVIFGQLDAMKFISCMTLFAQAGGADSVFADALRTCGLEDRLTLEALSIE